MKKNKAAKINATMEWRGRRLLCNGVCVAEIWHPSGGLWYPQGFMSSPRGNATERTARHAINRRFKLPLDFGESK
jgi:hypothetical protein